ncbi:MAG: hypothetical protein AVDCRST_MAG33-3383 [uncultured Thermomicrobiales bacterium]|uniref:Xylose isomerase-like TIM barrel domain-containing protein n=1 Tax=uncultured Thermomicrobiales bacterium TaxID=1645740 RepID=A0A6J4VKM3_9BACT|nr:MAG: hypothetical protein AVDCRST_MAG33-3383 [uncultured Thermomicrobiales bacterium]
MSGNGNHRHVELGINLGFAGKRWPEPEAWCRIVREQLGLRQVQFSFDLLDPSWPRALRRTRANDVRTAAAAWDIEIHSAFVGLANYTYNGLLDPDQATRHWWRQWWLNAVEVAADIGAKAVGGPLGGMSVADASDPGRRERLTDDLVESVVEIARVTKAAGLRELLIEPTPLRREIPHTPERAGELLARLDGHDGVPVRYLIDLGHALYRPLYADAARLDPWLAGLGDRVGAFHLQNTDTLSDSHWGWPDARGTIDLAANLGEIRAAGHAATPLILEVFYPFEADDDAVLASLASSVAHCRGVMDSVPIDAH